MACKCFFILKTTKKEFPIQISYNFQESLQDYYTSFYSGLVEKPDFTCLCPVCKSSECAVYHGFYIRTAICPVSGFSVDDFPVMRFKCCFPDKQPGDPVTFSLLHAELVPYKKLSLLFMVLAVWLRLSCSLSLFKTVDLIEAELNKLEDVVDFVSSESIRLWENMITTAYKLLVIRNDNIRYKLDKSSGHNNCLIYFIEFVLAYKSTSDDNQIRGPDILALDFFHYEKVFLFGVASQHR